MKKISWIKANLGDSGIARLIAKLSKSNGIEAGSCGCGCGDSVTTEARPDARPKQA
jgi:hypothetical protein